MKFQKILIAALACVSLASCDFSFEDLDEIDTTLYELKFTTNLDKAKTGISAQYHGQRPNEEVEALRKLEVPEEIISKAGTCVDGTYFFFEQDPIDLKEPFIPGYEFLGWYDGDNFLGYMDPDYDGNPDYIWNMPNKNITLQAKYKLMEFEILYMDEGTNPAICKTNPTTWNVEQGEVTLQHADRTNDGFQFDGWTFAMGGGAFYDGYVTKLNEQFLIDSGAAKIPSNGQPITFALHENYSVITHSVKLTFDPTVIEYVMVFVTPVGGNEYTIEIEGSHFLSGGVVEAVIAHNAEVVILPTPYDPDTQIDGIYFGTYKISTEVPLRGGLSTGYKIVASQEAEVELRTMPN